MKFKIDGNISDACCPPKQESETSGSFLYNSSLRLSLAADLRSGDISSSKEKEGLPETTAVLS